MVTSTKWRVRIPDGWVSANSIGCALLEMYETVDGADLCPAATMTASATFSSFSPSNANDGNITTFWTTGANAAPGGGHWLQAEFGATREINFFNYRGRPDGFREDPKEIVLEYWDGAAWQTALDVAAIPVWQNGETRSYVVAGHDFNAPTYGAHRYWRISIPTANADGLIILVEAEMRETISGLDVTGSGTATGTVGNFAEPGEGVTKLFDNNTSSQWQPAVPAHVDYDFGLGNAKEIVEIVLVQNDSFTLRTPATIEFFYSDDGAAWTSVTSFTVGTTWSGGTKMFRLVGSPTGTTAIFAPGASPEVPPTMLQASQGQFLASIIGTSDLPVSQASMFAAANFPAEFLRTSQADIHVAYAATMLVRVPQAQLLVAGRGRIANPRLRAWTFSMDGHDFYVLRLGDTLTLVFDLTSEQWVDWGDLDQLFWRPNMGINWSGGTGLGDTYGSNVLVGDDTFGLLWFLDPDQPYDEHPDSHAPVNERFFDRITMGQMPIRGRESIACYAAWLTTDMGRPAYEGASVTLSISDDAGETFFDAGSVAITAGVFTPELSWYSLGQIDPPGRLFKITDDGAVARIDGMEMNDPDDSPNGR